MTAIFLIAMGVIFTAPFPISRLCGNDYCAPLVVVQTLRGSVPGQAFPHYAFVFHAALVHGQAAHVPAARVRRLPSAMAQRTIA